MSSKKKLKKDLEDQVQDQKAQIQELMDELRTLKAGAVSPSSPGATADVSSMDAPPWMRAMLDSQRLQMEANERRQREQMEAQDRRQKEQMELQKEQMELQKEQMEVLNNRLDSLAVDPDANPQPQQARSTGPKPQAPPKMNVNISLAKFKSWKETWNDFARLSKIDNMDAAERLSFFRSYLSLDMRSTLTHAIETKPTDSVDQVLVAIEKHIRSKRNITLDLVAFDDRTQQASELFDSYLVAIRELAEDADLTAGHCNDCGQKCLDRRLSARLLSGIQDEETRKKLLALSPFPALKRGHQGVRGRRVRSPKQRRHPGQGADQQSGIPISEEATRPKCQP